MARLIRDGEASGVPSGPEVYQRRLEFVARASAELSASLDYELTLRRLAEIAVPEIADWCAVDVLEADGQLRRLAVRHTDPARVELVHRLQERYPPRTDAAYGVHAVLRTGEVEIGSDISEALLTSVAQDAEHLAILRGLGLRSYAIAPLKARDGILGAITLVNAESGRRFDEGDRSFIEDLARRAAMALDNALLVREVEGARDELQHQAAQLEEQAAELELQKAELELHNDDMHGRTQQLMQLADELEVAHQEKLALLESTSQGVYGIDTSGDCTFINPAGAALLGYDAAELIGRNMHEAVHHTLRDGRHYPIHECPIYRAAHSGDTVHLEDEVLWRRDGTSFSAEYAASPVRIGGQVHGAVVWFQDITERKALEARQQLLGTVMERSLNEIYIFDAETLAFIEVNRGARENLGYSMAELRSLTPVDIKPHYTQAEFRRMVEPLLTGAVEALRFETVHQRKDGSLYDVEVHLQLSRAGERAIFAAIILDITARRRDEEERRIAGEAVRQARDEAERANRAKSEFLAAMSHELRTPLNAIGGYTDLIELGIHGEVNEAQREALLRIRKNQLYLIRLINDILRFAKIEAGQLEFDMQRVGVPELLNAVEPLVQPQAEARGLRYHCHYAPSDMAVHGDGERIQQILLNLIGNAIKFTEPGGTITLAAEPAGDDILIRVTDSGRGIPPDRLDSVFDPFVQLGRERNESSQQGVGLGLAISRDLARFMDGDLSVDSVPGQGSTFTLRLRQA
jgi:PAS domain S-box-containing protein